MKRNRGTCKAKTAEECFNCPLPECTRGCKKLIGEEEYIKIKEAREQRINNILDPIKDFNKISVINKSTKTENIEDDYFR